MASQLTGAPRDSNFTALQQTYNNVQSNRQTVASAGTAVKLITASTECKRLDVTALYANTDMVVVGGSAVVAAAGTRKGVPLAAGNTYTFYVTDVSSVWIDSVVNGEGVSFNYFY